MPLRALTIGFILSICATPVFSEEAPEVDPENAAENATKDKPPALPEPRLQRHNRELASKLSSESIWWLDPEQQVLALYQPETTGAPQGAVLLLADFGQHARWPGLQQELREQLPWAGWHSLSIALPLAKAEAPPEPAGENSAEETSPEPEPSPEQQQGTDGDKDKTATAPLELQLRAPLTNSATLEERQETLFALLDSAREQLKAKNLANQAVIAEGEALWWVTYWLTERQPAEFGALIMLTPSTPDLEKAPSFNELLGKLKINQQLDLIRIPENDLSASRQREAAARRQQQNYQRLTVSGLSSEQLAKRLYSWLNRYLAGMEKRFR